MLLPFVILDFPLGKLSDKIGEKKMLMAGFLIMTSSVLAIPLMTEPLLWLWAVILFMTRVGAATIESLSESYFFKVIKKRNAPTKLVFLETPYLFLTLLVHY